jgi:hypothetical protein
MFISYRFWTQSSNHGVLVEFPFKLVVWDEKQDEDDESEHVVYTPGEPIDPELQLDYLAGSFTFPRSQLAVFYQNMIGILTSSREAEEEE